MKTLTDLAIVSAGGYWSENVYVTYVIRTYDWGAGHRLYNRESFINGKWVSHSKSAHLDELLPNKAVRIEERKVEQ